MSTDKAKGYIDGLYENMFERWERKVTRGRFMQELMAGTLPMEAIRLFCRNWAYYVFEINNLIAVSYQRHIGFFKRHPDLMMT